MANQIQIKWGIGAQANADAQLAAMRDVKVPVSKPAVEWARIWIALMIGAQQVTHARQVRKDPFGALPELLKDFWSRGVVLAGAENAAQAEANGVGDLFYAVRALARHNHNNARRVTLSLPPGGVEDVPRIGPSSAFLPGLTIPAKLEPEAVLTVAAGPFAGLLGSWLGERVEKSYEVDADIARTEAAAKIVIEANKIRAAKGEPPMIPDWVARMAAGERAQSSTALQVAVGIGLAGLIGLGAYVGGKAYFRKQNPPRRRPPAPPPPRRRRNPLRGGYSQASVDENIARERRRGKSPQQAAAIAYKHAREEHKKQKGGRLPAHLQPKASNPKKTAKKSAPKRRANPKKAAPKKAASKKTTRKKANPPKSDRFKRPKGNGPYAKFIRSQMAKGRSIAQARAAWKLKKKNPCDASRAVRRNPKKAAKRKPSRRKAAKRGRKPVASNTPRAKFMRAQKRKGASPKQAKARWAFKQNAKKRGRKKKAIRRRSGRR